MLKVENILLAGIELDRINNNSSWTDMNSIGFSLFLDWFIFSDIFYYVSRTELGMVTQWKSTEL